jgi:hypothetical protein
MISKKIDTLIVRDGDNILRYKLVAKDEGYELHEESNTMSPKEQKYFKKDLSNIINSTVQVTQ